MIAGRNDFKTPFIFSLVLLLGMFLGYKMSLSFKSDHASSQDPELDQLIQLIQEHYVDSLNTDMLYQNGIQGIISSLDPHTIYIPKKDLIRADEELQGEFFGIGIEFYLWKDTVRVASVMEDGPSAKSGICAGDKILSIDNENICSKKLTDEEVIQKIRGQHQSDVKLQIMHPDHSLYSITIKRDQVAIKTVSAYFMLEPGTGYISIRMFSETTAEEFHNALGQLIHDGMKKLIIDVRGNPGGYMDAVTQMADELIAGKQLLIQTKGKHSHEEVYSEKEGLFEKGDLAILIDENAASASEILAGIIQDLDRGVVIGRRSYGKGLVQEQFTLSDQSAIRITIARYYLPSGRCIQKDYSEGKAEYHEDIYKRYQQGELVHADSIHHASKPQEIFHTKNQRLVYAHEGISPDYFMGMDSTLEKGMNFFYENHIAEEFCNSYYFLHKKEFRAEKNVSALEKTIHDNKALWDAFLSYTKTYPEMKNAGVANRVKQHILAGFAQLVADKNTSAYFIYKEDPMLQKAESLLK